MNDCCHHCSLLQARLNLNDECACVFNRVRQVVVLCGHAHWSVPAARLQAPIFPKDSSEQGLFTCYQFVFMSAPPRWEANFSPDMCNCSPSGTPITIHRSIHDMSTAVAYANHIPLQCVVFRIYIISNAKLWELNECYVETCMGELSSEEATVSPHGLSLLVVYTDKLGTWAGKNYQMVNEHSSHSLSVAAHLVESNNFQSWDR